MAVVAVALLSLRRPPAPPSPTPAAAPGASPGMGQCRSTGAHAGYTDSWCTSNCNWTPPNCPSAYCACGPSAAADGIWDRLLGARGIVPTIRPADDIREQEEGGAASLGGASIWDVFTRGRDRKLLRGQEKAGY